MTCPILTAKKYQLGFKAGLLLVGFEDEAPQWMGTDEQWNTYTQYE